MADYLATIFRAIKHYRLLITDQRSCDPRHAARRQRTLAARHPLHEQLDPWTLADDEAPA